jgi:hypothetical protein
VPSRSSSQIALKEEHKRKRKRNVPISTIFNCIYYYSNVPLAHCLNKKNAKRFDDDDDDDDGVFISGQP